MVRSGPSGADSLRHGAGEGARERLGSPRPARLPSLDHGACRGTLLTVLLAIDLGGCTPSEPVTPPRLWDLGAFPDCAEPGERFSFREEGSVRGLGEAPPPEAPTRWIPGVAALDLDADGDVDLARLHAGAPAVAVHLSWNDGTGHFSAPEPVTGTLPFAPHLAHALGAADLDGDRRPELLLTGPGHLMRSEPGPDGYGPWTVAYADPQGGSPHWTSFAVGDADSDGDLDLVITATFAELDVGDPPDGSGTPRGGSGPNGGEPALGPPSPDLLLGQEGGAFVLDQELLPYGRAAYAQIATFTDRERDGDLDLFVPSEFGPSPGADPSAFWRNDSEPGGPIDLVNDAPETGFDADLTGMGLDSADLNGDGWMDWCVVQVGSTFCAVSDGAGRWVESGLALGLGPSPRPGWSGYGLELHDFDHDGLLDGIAAGGSVIPEDGLHVDRFWHGEEGGTFADIAPALGLADPDPHFGLAVADFDGNGAADFYLASGGGAAPKLHMAECRAGHAVVIELEGPPGNSLGFGAQVRVRAGGLDRWRELHSLRAVGQGPAELWFGLGDTAQIDEIEVHWPGGLRTLVPGPLAAGHRWSIGAPLPEGSP